MSKILSIIAPEGFQQIEYLESKRALEEQGHTVVTASTQEIATDKLGYKYDVDLLIDGIKEKHYDAILFVGGPGIYAHFDDVRFQNLARDFYEAGKLTTAICAAPTILGRAGLLSGKIVTCFDGEAEHIKESGATYTGASVEKDGLIITADGPGSAYNFGLRLAEEL